MMRTCVIAALVMAGTPGTIVYPGCGKGSQVCLDYGRDYGIGADQVAATAQPGAPEVVRGIAYIEISHIGTQDGTAPVLQISTVPITVNRGIPPYANDVVPPALYARIAASIRGSGCSRVRDTSVGPAGTLIVSQYDAAGTELFWCRARPSIGRRLVRGIGRLYRAYGIRSDALPGLRLRPVDGD